MKQILIALSAAFLLAGCSSSPMLDENDVAPEPKLADKINAELQKTSSLTQTHVIGCVVIKKDAKHFLCTGEFSYVIPSMATNIFKKAIDKVRTPDMRIDFSADQGLGSQMVAATLGAMGGALASGGATGTDGYFFLIPDSKAAVQFTTAPAASK